MKVSGENNGFTFKGYAGDARTLLAFNLTKAKTKDPAEFTIQIQPGTYYDELDLHCVDRKLFA
jgi:hypothetical protein